MAKPNNTHFKVKIPPHTIFNLKFVLQHILQMIFLVKKTCVSGGVFKARNIIFNIFCIKSVMLLIFHSNNVTYQCLL